MSFKGATRVNFVENENRAQFIITLKLYKNCASEKCGVGYKKRVKCLIYVAARERLKCMIKEGI